MYTAYKLSCWHLRFFFFWRILGYPLGMKTPGDSFSGIPLCFRWRLGINSFWCQLGYSLELSRWYLIINSVWNQIGLPLGFAIPGDSFSGISPCFLPLGFTLIICYWGTIFSPCWGFTVILLSWRTASITKGQIAYIPLNPVAY